MDKYEKLERIVETNFQLNAMQTRELGVEFRRRLEAQSADFRQALLNLGDHVTEGFRETGEFLEGQMSAHAERAEAAVEAIRTLGDGSVDIRKEIEELKRRVKDLEDRAS